MLQLEQSIYTSSPYSIQGPGLGTPCVTNRGWKESFRNFASVISVPDDGVNYQFSHSPSKLGYVFCACRKVQPLGDSRRAPFVHMIATGEGNEPAPEEWLRAFRFQDGSDPEALSNLELTNAPEEDTSVQIPESVAEDVQLPALLAAVIQKILSNTADVIKVNAASLGEALGILRRIYTLLPVAMRHKVRAIIRDKSRVEVVSSMTLCITLTDKSGFSGEQKVPMELQWLCSIPREEADKVLDGMNKLLKEISSVSYLSYNDYRLLFRLVDDTPFSISAGTEEQLNKLRSCFSPDLEGRPSKVRDFWLKMRSKIRLNVKTVEQFTERWNESLALKDENERKESLKKLAKDSYCHWPAEEADTKYYQLLFGYYQKNLNRRLLIQFVYGYYPKANVSRKENLKGFLKFLLDNDTQMYEVACLLKEANQKKTWEIADILDEFLPEYGPKSLEELERWNQKNLFSEQVGLSEEAKKRCANKLFEEMTAQPDQGLEEIQKAYETYLKPLAVAPEWNSIEQNLTGKIKTISDFQSYQRLRAALGMEDAPGTLDELCRSKFQALSETELKQLYPNGRGSSAGLSPELYDEYITIILTNSSQTVKSLGEMLKRIPKLKEERYDEAWSSVLLELLKKCSDMESFRSWGDLYQELGSIGRVDLESGLNSWLGESADIETLRQAEAYCMERLLASWTSESKKRWYSNARHLLVFDETKSVDDILKILSVDSSEHFLALDTEELIVLLKRCEDISRFVRVLYRCTTNQLQTPEIQQKIVGVWKNDFLPKVSDKELNEQNFLSYFFEEKRELVFDRELRRGLLNEYLLCRLGRISGVQRSGLSEQNEGIIACNQLEADAIAIREQMILMADDTSEAVEMIREYRNQLDRQRVMDFSGFTTYKGAIESLKLFEDDFDKLSLERKEKYQICCKQLERIQDAPKLQELLDIADALLPQRNGKYDTETQNCFQKLLQRFLDTTNSNEAFRELFFEMKVSNNKLLKDCTNKVREKLDLYDLYLFNVRILEEGKNSKLCESESVEQWNWYFNKSFTDKQYKLLKSLLSAQSTVQKQGLVGEVFRVMDPNLDSTVGSLLPKKRKDVFAWELRSLAQDGKKALTEESSDGVKHLAANAVRFALTHSDEEMLRLLLPAFRLSNNQPPLEEHVQAVWNLIDDGTLCDEDWDRLCRILQESPDDLPDEKASVWTGKKQDEELDRGAEEKENDGNPAPTEPQETGEDDSVPEKANGPKRAKPKDRSAPSPTFVHDIRAYPHVFIAGIITALLLVFLLWSIGTLLGILIHLGDKPNDAQTTTAVTQPYKTEEETPEAEEQTSKKKDTKAKAEANEAEGKTANTGDEAGEAEEETTNTGDEDGEAEEETTNTGG